MNNAIPRVPRPANEPILAFAPGSPERAALKAEIERLRKTEFDIPVVIGGKQIRTGKTAPLARPDCLSETLGRYHLAGEAEAKAAIAAALAAKAEWESLPWEERAAVFLRMAELITGPWRLTLDAACMLGQSKTPWQAEIDAVCEVADFLRYNPAYMERLYEDQPGNGPAEWNRMSLRALDGFVYAVTPFNFTSIACNLATSPAMMGNTVVWKPASSSILSNWLLMQIYEEAGLPPGVINFLPGPGSVITKAVLGAPEFAGLHFTGSTAVFRSLWQGIGEGLPRYRNYPRIVGETGGKDFIFVDPSADLEACLPACIRGAFEYQGQKCSAASRLYVPKSTGPAFLEKLAAEIKTIPMGEITDFRNFMGAVIDEASFDNISGAIARAKKAKGVRILAGGGADKSKGFFIEPTLILSEDPHSETLENELFGPVLTAYVYDDSDMDAAYRLVDGTSPYALTGAVWAKDRRAIVRALDALRHSAGNLYVNDKPTGAVVGRQPFGGARASGTNDKAGSMLNLLRWASAGAIKENFAPARVWRYAHMDEA
jgi:1-pyrroline-5-carboxylate dehydrogenase